MTSATEVFNRRFLASVGDNCIDRFAPPLDQSLVGGNALNVAVQMARLGCKTAYLGAVGDDADGRRVAAALADNGVDISGLRLSAAVTAFTEIVVDAAGERSIGFENFGACNDYAPSAQDVETLRKADHIHIGWLNDGGRLAALLVDEGRAVSRDVSINADAPNLSVAGLAIAFASASGPREAALAAADDLLAGGAKLAVVTRGSAGSLAKSATEMAETGIVHVDVVDTTGAGDSFIAGFIVARSEGLDLSSSLRRAAKVAARTCTHIGGFPQ